MLMLELFKERGVARDLRLKAAQGRLEITSEEAIAILALLVTDEDADVRSTAEYRRAVAGNLLRQFWMQATG